MQETPQRSVTDCEKGEGSGGQVACFRAFFPPWSVEGTSVALWWTRAPGQWARHVWKATWR